MDSNKSFLTPVCQRVCKSLCNPLNVVSSVLLLLSAMLLFALDFSAGIVVLPLAVLDFVAVMVAYYKSKRYAGKFGLPFLKFSAFFGFAVVGTVFALLTVNYYFSIFEIIRPFEKIDFLGLPFPWNLLNSGFLSFQTYALPLSLFLLAKAVVACSLADSVRKNLPKSGGFIVAVILMLLSLSVFLLDTLSKALIIPSVGLAYVGPDPLMYITMYLVAAVSALAAVAVILEIIKVIITYVKLRK